MTVSDQLPSHHITRPSWYGPRFDNPWPTWTGDKKFSEVMQWMKEKRAMGVPDYGWLLNNKTPTIEELGCAAAQQAIPCISNLCTRSWVCVL
jgi:hypothetical protein